jgi:predicted nucleic acid-binding protein
VIVVTNASPIINPATIGRLEWLSDIYGRIIVAVAVDYEGTVRGHGQPAALELQTWPWFETRHVLDRVLVANVERALGAGEAEAIALAVEMHADRMLLEARRGRAAAARFSLPVIGLLGVFVVAKHHGYLSAIHPVLDDLKATAGFWIGNARDTHVLQSVGV